jgi:hypothetical protein
MTGSTAEGGRAEYGAEYCGDAILLGVVLAIQPSVRRIKPLAPLASYALAAFARYGENCDLLITSAAECLHQSKVLKSGPPGCDFIAGFQPGSSLLLDPPMPGEELERFNLAAASRAFNPWVVAGLLSTSPASEKG